MEDFGDGDEAIFGGNQEHALFGGAQEQDVQTLVGLGFSEGQATTALKKFPGDAERAANYLMSPSRYKNAGAVIQDLDSDSDLGSASRASYFSIKLLF